MTGSLNAREQFQIPDRAGLAWSATARRWRRNETAIEPLESRRLLSAAPLNLLFFGNSFTNNSTDGPAYDMPATLKSIAVADGFPAPNVYEQILLGETLADHLNAIAADGSSNIIVSSLPAGQTWNDVVLQEYSTRPTDAADLEGDVPLFESDALQLFNDVKANSPSVHGVLYETWARGSLNSVYPTDFTGPTDMQNQLQTNYNLAAGNINSADGAGSVTVSPVGEAWRALGWEASLYSTISGDGVQYHPSTEGILLNAMVNFDTIYDAEVSNIPIANVSGILSNLGLSSSTWTTLAAVADAAVQANNPIPGNGSLSGSQAGAASSYNLTTLGTGDWAHWGTGNLANAFDHKATGNSQISNVTELGSGGNYGSYFSTSRDVSWTDGTPLVSDSGDDNYIWANDAIGAGYSFTVPASTTGQTLYAYAGGYSSGGQLTAHLSDNSAADYVATASGSGAYTNLYTITFKADSAGQTLTVSYVKSSNINGTGGSVDLIAAVLVGTPIADTTPPTASVTSAPTLTTAGSTPYSFTVNYTDNVGVNALTLGNNNLLITGTGYSQAATLVSTGLTNGPTVVATYSVPAPAGGWSNSSNGAYTIALQATQVADTSGNYAAAVASLGTFAVNIPLPGAGSLSASQATAASGYNLTALGTSDWAHWGTGNVASAFDHKATGNSQISNVSKLGSGGSYGSYFSSSRDVSWTDGTPLASDSGDDNYIWANNAIGAGYSFTVPASTTTQTLYVYAGGYSSGGTLTAHLSGGAAADYVATASGSGVYTNLYTITFNAAAAGQTLTISYVKTTNIDGTGGSVDLIAAALVGTPAPDTTPPTASVTSAPTLATAGSTPYTFTVTYTDNVAVNALTLGNNNLLVTGSGYSQTATLVNTGPTNGPTVVATYSVPAPAGGWSNSTNGTYTIALQATQVADTSGNFAAAVANLGTFSVNVPLPGAGSLAGSQATAASIYNLTALGTSDWAHWGTGNVATAFDHKATGNSQISNVTKLGSGGSYGSYVSSSRNVSWTDGTPLASDSGDDNYIWANNATGAGYSFTVPAGTNAQTLYVYAGGYSSGATLTAHLSDGSAADYVVTASGSGTYSNLYTITFRAASAGQTLTISYVKSTNVNGTGGSVDLIAAAFV